MNATLYPWTGIAHMLDHPFMARAYAAGSVIALCCGLVGYFVVLRAQVFTGDALSHVAFTGALAALAAGVDLRLGLFGACIGFGVAMGLLGPRGRADDVVIGSTFAWILGLGVLFLAVYSRSHGVNGTAGASVLFGSIFGLSEAQAAVAGVVAAGVIAAMVVMARPLLFASIDEAAAAARGVPVRTLGVVFLAVVGATAGEATQAVGALLLLGLLAAPAAAAHRLTSRPWMALPLSGGLALGSMWVGLGLSYAVSSLPPSVTVIGVASVAYVTAVVAPLICRKRTRATRRSNFHFR